MKMDVCDVLFGCMFIGVIACTPPYSSPPVMSIPGGVYRLGCGGCEEAPSHSIEMPSFRMDIYEARAIDFNRCVRAGACRNKRPGDGVAAAAREEPESAAAISYLDAVEYCTWRGGRLPTNDEWEIAARGNDGRKYPWGDAWDPKRVSPLLYRRDGIGFWTFTRVGQVPQGRSAFGLYDMAGAAPEFVQSSPKTPITRGGPRSPWSDVAHPDEFTTYRAHVGLGAHEGSEVIGGVRCAY